MRFRDPETPLTVAVIAAVPTPTPVASPLLLTVATASFALDHATAALVTLLPFESRIVAEYSCVAPTAMVTAAGETVTDAIVGAPPLSGGGSVGPPQAVRNTSAKATCGRRVLMGAGKESMHLDGLRANKSLL